MNNLYQFFYALMISIGAYNSFSKNCTECMKTNLILSILVFILLLILLKISQFIEKKYKK